MGLDNGEVSLLGFLGRNLEFLSPSQFNGHVVFVQLKALSEV